MEKISTHYHYFSKILESYRNKTPKSILDKIRSECLNRVSKDGQALVYVPEELQDKEMCLAAVRECGYALEYVPKELRNDKDICLAAVSNNGMALGWVPSELRDQIKQELGL